MLNKNTLSNYSLFYGLSKRNGVNHIFNEYMGFDRKNTVPVGISHGIDFEHCYSPMDVYGFEPIHWAYNKRIFEKSKNIKPCLLMAHPWSIVVDKHNLIEGNGTLLIGPPPGVSNDQLLYDKIKNNITSDWSILIKGEVEGSMQFWREKGVNPISAGNNNNPKFFYDLFYLLSSYRYIVACTFSSAVIFAASIGKKISFVDGYKYSSYDSAEYLNIVNFESDYSRSVVSEFINADRMNVSKLAREILGFDMLTQKDRVKCDYFKLLRTIDSPVYSKVENKVFLQLKTYLALKFSRPGLINKSIGDSFLLFNSKVLGDNKKVMVKTLDEISIWTNGRNKNNFNALLVPYKKNVTIPGGVVDKY